MVGSIRKVLTHSTTVLFAGCFLVAGQTFAADSIKGQVLGAGAPIAGSTVTLWAASTAEPKQLARAKNGPDGRFELPASAARGSDFVLHVIAKGGRPKLSSLAGDNPGIALVAVLGSKPPVKVTLNQFTTVASLLTNAQFLSGTAPMGHALGLRIAAGNVPNFVDLTTGGWGTAIQDPLNGPQTPTMAYFATLADALAGCVARVTADACSKLFAASTSPQGNAPTDTLGAAESIGLPGPWAAAVDGNDNVWISNFAAPNSPIMHPLSAPRFESSV